MHGKSLAAARLGWPNSLASLPDFHSLAYLPERAEAAILDDVRARLASGSVAAVFLEPLLGSRGGYMPSRAFAGQLAESCAAAGTVLILDEIFTGFHRTGPLFLHQDLGVTPDILLVGKSMGNGFPVSGVAVDRRFSIESKMLPGSTYAGNPLAAAAVVATLREMRALPMSDKVAAVETTIRNSLADLEDLGVALRGKGALWVLEFPRSVSMRDLMSRIIQDGVIPSQTANYIRLLPAATITPAHLAQACEVIRRACHAQLGAPAARPIAPIHN
jgi:acetylornithine/succinyldiaminopimelate/putrescine aminotransferase